MEQFAPGLLENYNKLETASAEDYETTYLAFENISIDYALIEKVQNLLVVQASFDWMDLGSFADIAKAIGSDESGNHVNGSGGKVEIEEGTGILVENHEDKPIAVIGLDNCVIVNTPQGLLVARKDLSQKVGDVSKRLNGAA
jgi:mannose-1-phosphate guanylyltransferase